MILNSTQKRSKGMLVAMLMILLLSAVTSIAHAKGNSVASITPGGNGTAEGARVQATGSTGKLKVETGSSSYSVDGSAVRYNGIWPDPTVARAVSYPGKGAATDTFTATSGTDYYAKAYAQYNMNNIYGQALVTVN